MTQILFVAGLPRSGSTLVGRLLADRFRVQFCGELMHLAALCAPVSAEPCGCGIELSGCDYWRPVMRSLGRHDADEVRATIKTALDADDVNLNPTVTEVFAVALEAMWSAHDAPIVESSKIPSLARYLRQAAPSCELHVLHLVRDPSAVIVSASSRPLGRPEVAGSRPLKLFPPGAVADRWRRHNAQAARLQRSANSYHLVRLEDLIVDADAALAPVASDMRLRPRIDVPPIDHSLRGNPSRFEMLNLDPARVRRAGDSPFLALHRLRALMGPTYGYQRVDRG